MGRAYSVAASGLDPTSDEVLGVGENSMADVEARARRAFPGRDVIAWEGDAATFRFSYVSPAAEAVLGYPCERWTQEASFWAEQVVVPEDRDEAITYCALATAKRADHIFEYRARRADGRIILLRDLVRVVVGPKGIASRLRGLMFDITRQVDANLSATEMRLRQSPSRAILEAMID